MELCTPAILYMGFSALSLISAASEGITPGLFFIYLLYIAVWTVLLQFLCMIGLSSLSWFLLFLPVILVIVLLVFFANIIILA
jgi:hypothetical protein